MAYATIEDIRNRCRRTLSSEEETYCETTLEDAALIIDAYNSEAKDNAKLLVSCNMIIRALGDGEESSPVPIGSSQGTMSALGYSQTWSLPSGGTTGEMYLTKMDKKLLGVVATIASRSPLESMVDE